MTDTLLTQKYISYSDSLKAEEKVLHMSDPLFSIKNLSCSYSLNPEEKVLHIDQLDIPKGKLVFLLGASGCGKSTLLETLGLMNNTIAKGEILLTPNGNGNHVDIATLWGKSNDSELTQVRKKHYSFIFQNTNLMENFTAYENVCLSGMIKDDVSQEAVLEKARSLMNKIKLPETEVNLQTLAVNLSGGQRQRLAFVRALNNNASVLFGDEPTGNLDEANANELFGIIKSNLHEGLSAIIVSHDINLAVKFADQIIVITKDSKKGYGEVLPNNVFNRKDWENISNAEQLTFKEHLRSFYKAANEKLQKDIPPADVNTNATYYKLFLQKEGKVLFGKQFINLWILSLILFFTFLAIGFANGSLNYLNEKMNSAFVQWVTVSIPFTRSEHGEVEQLLANLQSPEVKNQFLYNNVTPYVKSSLPVWDSKRKDYIPVKSRSVDVEKDRKLLYQDVMNPENVFKAKAGGFKGPMDIGVIVTKRFLEEFNYSFDTRTITVQYSVFDTATNSFKDIPIPIAVRAIVNELPGKYDLIYPLYFYQAFFSKSNTAFDITNKNSTIEFFFVADKKELANEVNKTIIGFFAAHTQYSDYEPEVYLREDTLGYMGGYTAQVEFFPALPDVNFTNKLAKEIEQFVSEKHNKLELSRTYNYNSITENFTQPTYDEFSIYFQELDKVRDFASYILNKFNPKGSNDVIEVDVTKVKEKENFLFLSNVTYTISYLLVVFSTLAVGLFIFNLLKGHLSKVKMNIGTFKAIGLADTKARNIYVTIIFIFIALATAIALLLASVVGTGFNSFLTRHLSVEEGITYFKMLDVNTAVALGIILLSSFIISWFTIRKILNKTPGDLIYNR